MGDRRNINKEYGIDSEIQEEFKSRVDSVQEFLNAEFTDNIFKTSKDISNSSVIINNLKELYLSLTVNLGKNWHPYVNGRYMIFMVHGPWVNDIINLKDRYTISESTIDLLKKLKANNSGLSFNNLLPRLATDIDLPQLNNEFINISARNQSLTYFLRQTFLPDFSISYIEDQQNLSIIQYHDAWFKALELYRRGKLNPSNSKDRKNSPYFYTVPYLNAVWIVLFDIAMQIRGIIYLIGIKPVNHPLKEFLGNRSNSKITVYNIQYKTTNMYYEFFKNTDEFVEKLNKSSQENGMLLYKFKRDMEFLFSSSMKV
jgi:hypothetical protein